MCVRIPKLGGTSKLLSTRLFILIWNKELLYLHLTRNLNQSFSPNLQNNMKSYCMQNNNDNERKFLLSYQITRTFGRYNFLYLRCWLIKRLRGAWSLDINGEHPMCRIQIWGTAPINLSNPCSILQHIKKSLPTVALLHPYKCEIISSLDYFLGDLIYL